MTSLIDLAERIEAAEASEQRELLIEAFVAIVGPENAKGWEADDGRCETNARWKFDRMLDAGAYESAALTLADEETAAQALREAFSFIQATGWPVGDFKGALARATAAAALRAHAVKGEGS